MAGEFSKERVDNITSTLDTISSNLKTFAITPLEARMKDLKTSIIVSIMSFISQT